MTDGDEFSSWFTHDGGPCPLPIGTVTIRELQKTRPNAKVFATERTTIIADSMNTFVTLNTVTEQTFLPVNPWEWANYKKVHPNGNWTPKVLRYRVKKSPGVKLLEQIAKDPPIDLIPDPERKLLEYHPT